MKRSELKRTSPGSWDKSWPVLVTGNKVLRIRGPNSNLVKFRRVICRRCNDTISQPFDMAYERFCEWVIDDQGSALLSRTQIDFAEVYGPGFAPSVLNLIKYFAKQLGCRLADTGQSIPPRLVAILGDSALDPFAISFSINEEWLGMISLGDGIRSRPGMLGNYGTQGVKSGRTGKFLHTYLGGSVIGYMDVLFRYDHKTVFNWEGEIISMAQQNVRLGRFDSRTFGRHPFVD
jgi:hypothetical protein